MNDHKIPGLNSPEQQESEQMIYGLHPVLEALKAGKEIDRIFIGRGSKGELMQELKKELRERNLPWQEVPADKLNRLTKKNHQDVICFISSIAYYKLDQIVPGLFEQGLTPFILLLDRITDVRNFGAIARTAECAGVHALVIPERGSAQVSADAIRTSAGALSRIPVCRERELRRAVTYLQQSGIQIVAATEKGNDYHFKADLSIPTALMMGSEEDGVSTELLKICDQLIRIPMLGKISSLNVSVACGVILFEAVRQRISGSGKV